MLIRFAALLGPLLFAHVPASEHQANANWVRFGEAEAKRDACGVEAYGAIVQGLSWLIDNQSEEGFWTVGSKSEDPSVANTALALLALLGNGHTASSGGFQQNVSKGAAWLSGRATSTESVRELATATLVLAELRQFDGDSMAPLLDPVLAQLLAAQTTDGAWPASGRGQADAISTSWAAQAIGSLLRSEKHGLESPRVATLAWIKTQVKPSGKVANQSKDVAKEHSAALLLHARLALGAEGEQASHMDRQQNRFARQQAMPNWDQQDLEYWFAATTSQAVEAGQNFKRWWPIMRRVLLKQRNGTSGHWGAVGSDDDRGEVRSTAMAVLILEAPYRLLTLEPAKIHTGAPGLDFGALNPDAIVGIGAPFSGILGGRFGGRKTVRKSGGKGTEKPLAKALAWLAKNQAEDGSWTMEGARHPVRSTGLALLALIAVGSDPGEKGYRTARAGGIRWLRQSQNPETGRFDAGSPDSDAYDHAIATLAIAEYYNFMKSPIIRATLARALDHCLATRNADGVWSYDAHPTGDSNTSLTAWIFLALKTAEISGIAIDQKVWDDCAAWFDADTDPVTGRLGHRSRQGKTPRPSGTRGENDLESTEALTGATLLCRIFLGQDPKTAPLLEKHAESLRESLPEFGAGGSKMDVMFWYYGSHAMYQMGGKNWAVWNKAMKIAVLESQETSGELSGSWAPVGPWGEAGGRVDSTAIMALTLETYFRYERLARRR